MGWSSSTTRIRFPTFDLAFPRLDARPATGLCLASWVRRTILLMSWLALAVSGAQAQSRLEGVVVEQAENSLSLRLRQDGRTVKTIVSNQPAGEFVQKGDTVVALTEGSPPRLRRITTVTNPQPSIRGRIHSLNPASKRLTVETARGRLVYSILPSTAVFKDYRSTNWLNLHEGQPVVVQPTPENPNVALVILDPVSFLVRLYQPAFGRLAAAGAIIEVQADPTNPRGQLRVQDLDGKTTRLSYDSATRWHLGARFKSPRDFLDVESLVFGETGRAKMVVSLRAVPFLFESASLGD